VCVREREKRESKTSEMERRQRRGSSACVVWSGSASLYIARLSCRSSALVSELFDSISRVGGPILDFTSCNILMFCFESSSTLV